MAGALYGLRIGEQLVLDPQNAAFPVPVARNVGGFTLQELHMLDYPYFIDIRGSGLNREQPITSDLTQLAIPWASPIEVDTGKQGERKLTELLRSSDQSWLSSSLDIMPRIDSRGGTSYEPEGEQKSQLLGLIVAGRFDSYFAGKGSPLLNQKSEAKQGETEENEKTGDAAVVSGVIEHSPESARIVLFSSNDFLQDQVIYMTGAAGGSEYLNTLQLMANAVDWSLEETGLSSIRARGHFNRTLPPMAHGEQLFWEYLNYILAALALAGIALVQRWRKRSSYRAYLQLMTD